MKSLIFIYLFLGFTVTSSAQEGVRDLGKVNFLGKTQFLLSASLENATITYTLTDIENPEIPKKTFKLFSNSLENFKEALEDQVEEIDPNFPNLDEELEKYFYHFQFNNIYYIPDEQGPISMKLYLEKSIPVNYFNISQKTILKQEDIEILLANLYPADSNQNEIIPEIEFSLEKIDSLFPNQQFKSDLKKINIQKNLTKPVKYKKIYSLIQRNFGEEQLNILKNNTTFQKFDESIKIQENIKSNFIEKSKSLKTDSINLKVELKKIIDSISDLDNKINLFDQRDKLEINLIKTELLEEKLVTNNDTLLLIKNKTEELLKKASNQKKWIEVIQTDFSEDQKSDIILNQLNQTNIEVDELIRQLNTYNKNKEEKQSLNLRIKQIQTDNQGILDQLGQANDSIENINIKIDSLKKEKAKEAKKNFETYLKSPEYSLTGINLQLEFNNGYIENIVLTGNLQIVIPEFLKGTEDSLNLKSKFIKFTNEYPIGISAKTDIERLYETFLYSKHENEHYELNLSDLIVNIEEILALNRKDYSPANGVITIDLTNENYKELYKSKTKEILELKIFSDFIGITENKPNGLIQLELDKEIPLLTNRLQKAEFGAAFRWFVNRNANVGFFNFIKPQIGISKIENNQRYLVLTSLPNQEISGSDTLKITKYGASTLDLKQFERFILGTDINLLSYDNPTIKSTFLLNGGIRFGRTDLASNDSIPESNDFPRSFTNTIQPDLEAVWRINGDERFGLEISYAVNWVYSDQLFFDQKQKTLGFTEYESFRNSQENYKLQRVTIMAYLNTNPDKSGRLFFRYRANTEFGNWRSNFSQIQLGYSTPLNRKTQ